MSYFEDMAVGQRMELGTHHFTAEAIKTFGRAYDPQPFHVDEELARASSFGALAASGWHTAAVWMKLMVAARRRMVEDDLAAGRDPGRLGPSPGFTDLKWIKPVFAGDTIAYASEVIELRESRSKPDWGLMRSLNTGTNQNGELVFSFIGNVFVPRRMGPRGA
jgi:acyl dehydratase